MFEVVLLQRKTTKRDGLFVSRFINRRKTEYVQSNTIEVTEKGFICHSLHFDIVTFIK